jgi:hypothetical protein
VIWIVVDRVCPVNYVVTDQGATVEQTVLALSVNQTYVKVSIITGSQ